MLLARAKAETGGGVEAFELMKRLGMSLVLKNIPDTREPLESTPPWYVLIELTSGEPDGAEAAMERLLTAAWLLLWTAACAAQLQSFLNLRALVPQAPLQAELLGAHAQPPSQRSLGGQLWVLRIAGEDAPQQVLVPDAAAAQVPLHARLNLRWARGRWHGRYLSGWDMLPVQP